MKKVYILSLLLILSANSVFSQSGWFWQNPLPQGNDLLSIKFVNDNIGFACGKFGTILKTTNGGINWLVQHFNKSNTFNSISVKDSINIFVCGDSGQIMKSSNGGLNWLNVQGGTSLNLNKIVFVNYLTGYIVGNNGILLKTTNAGNNWFSGLSGTNNNLYTIYFKNQLTGYLSGSSIYRMTTDGGNIWTTYNLSSGVNFRDIIFLDNNTGFAAGNYQHFPSPNGIAYKTTNGGYNWFLSGSFSSPDCFSVLFKDLNTGFIASGYGIITTTNSGANWSWCYSHIISYFTSLDIINNTSYATEWGGGIIKSTNVGLNWTNQTNPFAGYSNSDIFFVNDQVGYICGSNPGDSMILKTTNSGINWVQLNGPTSSIKFSVFFTTVNTGYIVNGTNNIYKTVDGGLNWSSQITNSSGGFRSLVFINENIGFAGGYNSNIYKTTNGGLNWIQKFSEPTGTITSFSFPSANTGYAVDAWYGMIKTVDGGNSWTYIPYINNFYSMEKVHFINDMTGYVIGTYHNPPNPYYSAILKTTNSGINWQSVLLVNAMNNIRDIGFSDNGIAFAICDYGKIYKSTDYGNAWGEQNSITDNMLRKVKVINDSIIFIIGDKKTILKTINGGGNIIGINPSSQQIPQSFSLYQNYPNPFNPVTKIQFDIPNQSNAKIVIYDLLGREITTLVNEQLKPGNYEASWDGSGYASGVYFYSLVADNFIETKRMVLVK